MVEHTQSRIRDEAINWHIRLASASDEEWQEFTAWLEADPRHNPAYEAVSDEDAELDFVLAQREVMPVAANDDPEVWQDPRPSPAWRWGGIAASLALLAGVTYLVVGGANEQVIVTAPGETRIVSLDDGSQITLNGGTQLVFEGTDSQEVELVAGEARLDIRHDPAREFTVVMDSQRIVDIGTKFNISRDPDLLRVEVSEGTVRYEGFGKSVRLEAGHTLTATSTGAVTSGAMAPALMSGWMRGELIFHDAPLDLVARDLERASGIEIELDPSVADRPFNGLIQTRGDKETLRKRLEGLLALRVTETENGWKFEP
ncbi:MAG: FecR domain-containing protein [Novosphingobium sp.]|nr:FecR domain-containing protein [Novosphingobium sp.]